LDAHAATLETYFKDHPPRTVAEAQQAIKAQTGIERRPTQVQAFMKRLGMKCRKVGSVPGQAANPDKQLEQETFKTQALEPRLAEAQAGKRRVLFRDAAHFVLGAYLSRGWCFTRLFSASPSGRQRFNVLGAVDAVTKEIFTVTNDTYINAECVCTVLTQIAARYAGETITIVLDNARYQKCDWVLRHAAQLGIELLYLPSYSPNLNLIEERPTDCTGRPRQPQQHSNHPSFSSFGGSDRRSQTILSTKGGPLLLGHCLARWHAGFSA
jgi:hypothetical protein